MYLSADLAVFDQRFSVWVWVKERMNMEDGVKQIWHWRSRSPDSFFFRNKFDWGWSWYTETAASVP